MASNETIAGEPATGTGEGGGDGDTGNPGTENGVDEGDTYPRSISKDDAFHLLQNGRRRAVLRYLLAHPETEQVRMRDIAEEIAAWEHDTTVRQLSSDQRQRVYIALYQSHLPKLDDDGVINYNQSRGFIERTPLLSVFAPFIESELHTDTEALTLDGSTVISSVNGSGPGFVGGLSSLLNR